MKILEIKNINKDFEIQKETIHVLDNINFRINKGEFVSIIGGSGCGKSTLLRLISGLDTATSGEIIFTNEATDNHNVNCGFAFQEPRLLPWRNVYQNIDFGLDRHIEKAQRKEAIQYYIDLVGLQGFEHALPSQLSGGMQQRVSIGRALIGHPDLLLLDEPFGALDAFTRLNMQNEILNIWKKERTTMLLVTHDIDEAIYLSNRIIILSGRPGTVKTIIPVELEHPRDRSSDAFLSIRKRVMKEFFVQDVIPYSA